MKKLIKPFLGIILLAITFIAMAQNHAKIKIEITKEINGDKKTFKGEYESEEDMMADPTYQEFVGDDNQFHFFFDQANNEDVMIHMDLSDTIRRHGFRFDREDQSLLFHPYNDTTYDNSIFSPMNRFKWMDFEKEVYEKLRNLDIDLEALLESLENLSVDEEKKHVVTEINSIEVTDIEGNEFGKKSNVAEKDQL